MDASSFWDMLDINEVTREEFVLVTSYLVDTWRKAGLKVVADKFVKEAKLVEVKELDSSRMVSDDAFRQGGFSMDYWTIFCHEKLKLERLKGTQTNQQLTVDEICNPKIDTLCKLSKYIVDYTFANFKIADILHNDELMCKQPCGGTRSKSESDTFKTCDQDVKKQ